MIFPFTMILILSCFGCSKKEQSKKDTQISITNAMITTETNETSSETPTNSDASDSENSMNSDSENLTDSNPANQVNIAVDDTCDFITSEVANRIAKEISVIEMDTHEGVYRIENIVVYFGNQVSQDNNIWMDVTVEADWTTLRKPEDTPFIIGMNEAKEELATEDEKLEAANIIDGFVVNMEPLGMTENITEYVKVRLDQNDPTKYELFFPEGLNEDSPLYPMKEYYEEHFKEHWDEKIELGRETLKQNMN